MELRVVDFEVLTRHHKLYQDGIKNIELEKQKFIDSLEPIKKEMNDIIKIKYSSDLIVDNKTQEQKAERLQSLERDLLKLDSDFRYKFKKMTDDLNESSYDELSKLIEEWCKENKIDLVIGKMEVVYNLKEYEITSQILNLMSKRNIYTDH